MGSIEENESQDEAESDEIILDNSVNIVSEDKIDWSHFTTPTLRPVRPSILFDQREEALPVQTPESTSCYQPTPTGSIPYHRHSASRKAEGEVLLNAQLLKLSAASQHAEKEHDAQLRILLLQEKQEKERLLQEKMKSAILRHEMLRQTGKSLLEEGVKENNDNVGES